MKLNKHDAAHGQETDADHQARDRNDLILDADDDGNAGDIPRPLKAVREHCLWCCNGAPLEVRLCPAKSCPLWPYRFGKKPTADMLADIGDIKIYPFEDPVTWAEFYKSGGTVLKAIKRRSLDCSGYSKAEVRNCPFVSCSLHPFRFGTNLKRKMSPEQRKIAAERLKANIKGKEERTNGKLDRD